MLWLWRERAQQRRERARIVDKMPAPTAKPVIVLEWGAVYVRCGVAGEPCPRVRLPSPLGALAVGGERLNETAWRGALDEFVARLFAEELLTMPQKRIVLNVEDAALPRALRRALADALYDAGAERLAFAPSIACAAVGGDAPTSIVVDVGSSSSRCAAVVDGFLLDSTLAYADGCGVDAVAVKLPYETLERARAAVASLSFVRRRGTEAKSGPDVAFEGASVPFRVRGDSSEALFDGEGGLAALVHGVLRAAPIDARAALAKRVLVVGGGSLIPGLDARLLDELRARGVKDAAVLTPPCAACDAAWVGASLLAASTTLTGAARGDALPDIFEMKIGLPDVVAPQCVSDK